MRCLKRDLLLFYILGARKHDCQPDPSGSLKVTAMKPRKDAIPNKDIITARLRGPTAMRPVQAFNYFQENGRTDITHENVLQVSRSLNYYAHKKRATAREAGQHRQQQEGQNLAETVAKETEVDVETVSDDQGALLFL